MPLAGGRVRGPEDPRGLWPDPPNKITGDDPRWERFIAWLIHDPKAEFDDDLGPVRIEGESQAAFARRMGLSPNTVSQWKRNPYFKRLWEARLRESWGHPDILAEQLEALHVRAKTGDTKAIELYWKLVDKMTPERVQVDVSTSDVAAMSDEELAKVALGMLEGDGVIDVDSEEVEGAGLEHLQALKAADPSDDETINGLVD